MDIANSYYKRDCELQVIPKDTILKALKKLGYFNVDRSIEEKKYITAEIKQKKFELEELPSLAQNIRESNSFKKFQKHITFRIERGNQLSHYIHKPKLDDFYKSLTINELNYLGY
jgi:hypothetical protein